MSDQLTKASITFLHIKSFDREKKFLQTRTLNCLWGFTVRRPCLFYCCASCHSRREQLLSITRSRQKASLGLGNIISSLVSKILPCSAASPLLSLTEMALCLSEGALSPELTSERLHRLEAGGNMSLLCVAFIPIIRFISEHFLSRTLGILNGRPKTFLLSEGAPTFLLPRGQGHMAPVGLAALVW